MDAQQFAQFMQQVAQNQKIYGEYWTKWFPSIAIAFLIFFCICSWTSVVDWVTAQSNG